MLKIERKRKSKSDFDCLVVNGIIDKDSSVFDSAKGLMRAHLYNEKVTDQLTSLRVGDLEPHFASIEFPYKAEWNEYFDEVEVNLKSYHGKRERRIKFELQPYGDAWANPYTIAEYAEAIEEAVKTLKLQGVRYYEADELILNGFGIRCAMKAGNPLVKDEIHRCAQALKAVCEQAEKLLAASARRNSVTTFFRFPPEVKTACEQYLLYFVQFLEDLGIKANAEIKDDARRVLFSVTPADGPSALDQIRQALNAYLKLPGMPDFDSSASQYPNMAVQQLRANIFHLQSQLTLAGAAIQAKDAAIEALQFSNYQYRQLLSSDEKSAEQAEPLIGDTVHITKVEGKGVKIDLPLILRRLKRVLGVSRNKLE